MRRPRIFCPGPTRDEGEAAHHANQQRCFACGGPLSVMFEVRQKPPYVLRMQMRCALCQQPVFYDYLAGPGFTPGEVLAPLELAAAAEPTLLWDAPALVTALEAGKARVDAAHDKAGKDVRLGAGDALAALWELEKLPEAPEEVLPPNNAPLERALVDAYLAAGGRVPPEAKARFASIGQPRQSPFSPTSWAMVFFHDRAAFDAVPIPNLPEEARAELRYSVGAVLDAVRQGHTRAAAAGSSRPRVQQPPQRPIIFAAALGLLQDIAKVVEGRARGVVPNTVPFEMQAQQATTSFFALLPAYQAALQRAADVARALEGDGVDALPEWSRSPFGTDLSVVLRAAHELPAWPLDFLTVQMAQTIDHSVEALEGLQERARATGEVDARAAFEKVLRG